MPQVLLHAVKTAQPHAGKRSEQAEVYLRASFTKASVYFWASRVSMVRGSWMLLTSATILARVSGCCARW